MPHSDECVTLAERHVIEGTARIADHKRRIVDMQSSGTDTMAAEKLLALMEDSLSIMVSHRDQIRANRRK